MPKRKLEEELEEDWKEPEVKPGIKKNSLDSDEEDEIDEKKYEIMEDDDIEGQEDGAAAFDGEVHITPFNMKEELEEGHFDTDGNYHWKKDGKVVRDNWLENIDWVKIKQPDGQAAEGAGDDSDSGDSSDASPFDHIAVYRQMLDLMKPGESVAKTLRRLGGNKTISASERWRRKKAGYADCNSGNQQQVTDLTEMANRVLTKTGNMDIYQESYEHISSLIEKADKKSKPPAPARPATSYGDALDMYADDFDEKEQQRLHNVVPDRKHKLEEPGTAGSSKRPRTEVGGEKKPETAGAGGDGAGTKANGKSTEGVPSTKADTFDANSEVQWEFKWKEDSAEVHGPHSTMQMQAWVDSGYFKLPVWVRKVGQEGPFYTSKRVDFELYL